MRRPVLGSLLKTWAVIVILVTIHDLVENACTDPCCSGCAQSPINIDSASTFDADIAPLYFVNHFSTCDVCWNMGIVNRSLVLKPNKGSMRIEGGVLKCPYILDQLHFHWGESNDNGSEHSLDGQKFAMEAHMVYYNDLYGDVLSALGKPDGIVIIAVFVDVKDIRENPYMKPLASFVYKHPFPDEPIPLEKNTMKMFREVLLSQEYYLYDGSLTTPPCCENVLWLVFHKPVYVSKTEVNVFRRIRGLDGCRIQRNWRRTQPLNGRIVYNAIASNCPWQCEAKT